MIDLELSEGIQIQRQMVHAVAEQAMRPIAREYDEREHEKPWDFLSMMWQVSSALMPMFFSRSPTVRPGAPRSTTNAASPSGAAA